MSTPMKMSPLSIPVQGPHAAEVDREGITQAERATNAIHDRLAARCPATEASHPHALRFGALFLATIAASLHHAVSGLAEAWGYKREHLAAWLRGDWERGSFPVKVLWLIFTSPTAECREASRAVLRLLADHLGYEVAPRTGGVHELRDFAPRVYREGGDLAAAIDQACRDGRISTDERVDLVQLLRARAELTASMLASLAAHASA